MAPKDVATQLTEQLATATQKVGQLEYENRSLRERLDGLRKARASTTKVIKASTQFVDLAPRKEDVKLPQLAQLSASNEKCVLARTLEHTRARARECCMATRAHTGRAPRVFE